MRKSSLKPYAGSSTPGNACRGATVQLVS
jgi:hypothetical protein